MNHETESIETLRAWRAEVDENLTAVYAERLLLRRAITEHMDAMPEGNYRIRRFKRQLEKLTAAFGWFTWRAENLSDLLDSIDADIDAREGEAFKATRFGFDRAA